MCAGTGHAPGRRSPAGHDAACAADVQGDTAWRGWRPAQTRPQGRRWEAWFLRRVHAGTRRCRSAGSSGPSQLLARPAEDQRIARSSTRSSQEGNAGVLLDTVGDHREPRAIPILLGQRSLERLGCAIARWYGRLTSSSLPMSKVLSLQSTERNPRLCRACLGHGHFRARPIRSFRMSQVCGPTCGPRRSSVPAACLGFVVLTVAGLWMLDEAVELLSLYP
mmetsp:Transcript_10997/g.27577  ORF Transcript_10997/g.27577 Transcript_10997/m.27577 type:complete len:221 (-) Transcript_10997:256-918(-)